MRYGMPRRLLYSLAIVLAWLSFVVEGSHALITANATLAGNSITTGTAGLLVSSSQDSTPGQFATSQAGFGYSLAPGQSIEKYFFLQNSSPSNVPLDIDVTPVAPGGVGIPASLASAVTLEFTPVDASGTPTNTPASSTVQSMMSQHSSLSGSIPAGAVQRYKVKASLAYSYAQQNQSFSYDLYFTGTQHYAP